MEQGYVHVYTGTGKGKTTAAIGLAIRAAGAGFKVYFSQFLKGQETSELLAFQRFEELITIKRYGTETFITENPSIQDIKEAQTGFTQVCLAVKSGKYDVVILDEVNVAIYLKLINIQDLVALIRSKPKRVELIITGRNAAKEVIDIADVVTEMKEIKHYHTMGVNARIGIEM